MSLHSPSITGVRQGLRQPNPNTQKTPEIPKDSGDSLKGSGWHFGFGAIRPVTTHLYLEARFAYEKLTYDTIQFLGREGGINPPIDQRAYAFSLGASYRL